MLPLRLLFLWSLLAVSCRADGVNDKVESAVHEHGLAAYLLTSNGILAAARQGTLYKCSQLTRDAVFYPFNNQRVVVADLDKDGKVTLSKVDPQDCAKGEDLSKLLQTHLQFTKEKFAKAFTVTYNKQVSGNVMYGSALVYGPNVLTDVMILDDDSKTIRDIKLPDIPADCFSVTGKHCVYDYLPEDPALEVMLVNDNVVGVFCQNLVKKDNKGYTVGVIGGQERDREFLGQEDLRQLYLYPVDGSLFYNPSGAGIEAHKCKRIGYFTTPSPVPIQVVQPTNSWGSHNPNAIPMQCGPLTGIAPSAAAGALLVVLIVIAVVLLLLERKGKAKKEAFMRIQKAKKDDKGTTCTETQDGGTGTGATGGEASKV